MSKSGSGKLLLFGVPLLVVITAWALAYSPKPIDWTLSFSKEDTQPFGSKLLYDLLPVLFEESEIETSYASLHSYFDDDYDLNTNVIIINSGLYPEPADIEIMTDILEDGGSIFIAAQDVSEELKSWFDLKYEFSLNFHSELNDSISHNLANRKLKRQLGYWYKKGMTDNYFAGYDTLRTSVLGHNTEGKTNFIRIKEGNGNVYINLNPQAFTNYNLLVRDNYEYAFKCLSYLPKQRVIWDEYHKIKYDHQSRSTLSFIFDRFPLRLAWYTILIGVLIFFLFQSARRQRMVPIVKPPSNSTVNFVETVGRLYYSRKNHLDIARKRFKYLQAFIRSKYYINTSEMNDDVFQQLADKSTLPIRAIRQLFDMGNNLDKIQHISEEDLEQFNRRIEFFYEQCK